MQILQKNDTKPLCTMFRQQLVMFFRTYNNRRFCSGLGLHFSQTFWLRLRINISTRFTSNSLCVCYKGRFKCVAPEQFSFCPSVLLRKWTHLLRQSLLLCMQHLQPLLCLFVVTVQQGVVLLQLQQSALQLLFGAAFLLQLALHIWTKEHERWRPHQEGALWTVQETGVLMDRPFSEAAGVQQMNVQHAQS